MSEVVLDGNGLEVIFDVNGHPNERVSVHPIGAGLRVSNMPPAPSSGPDMVAELSIVAGLVEVVRYQVKIAGLDNPAASFDIDFRVLSACLFPIRFKGVRGSAQIYTRQESDDFDRLGAISKQIEFIETYGPVGDPMTIYRGWPKWFTIRVWLDSDGRDELRKADQIKLAWRSINPTFVVVGHEDHELVLMPEELEMFGLPIKGPLSPIVVEGGPLGVSSSQWGRHPGRSRTERVSPA